MSQQSEETDSHKNAEKLISADNWNDNLQFDLGAVQKNLSEIRKNIAHCKVKIIGVTKYYGIDSIKKGYEAGLRDFGESRALEAIDKIENLPFEIRDNSQFHFIGHLQTNKAEKVVRYFDYIHSVDSLKIAKAISEAACRLDRRVKILLQVNNAQESQKFGYSKDALEREISEILALANIEVVGLMNIAPLNANNDELQMLFKDLREYRDYLSKKFEISLSELSMGMSNDYKIAVKEGSTMVRIGRNIFKK